MLEHAELPLIFVLHVVGGLLPRERLGLDDRTARTLHEQVRQDDVVPEARIELHVVGTPDGVDRPDASGDRSKARFVSTQPPLEPRVDPLAVRPVGLLVEVPPADVGDFRIRKVADELAQGVFAPARVRVGEREDLAARRANSAVLRGRLAGARHRLETHAGLPSGGRLHELVRVVGRGVGDDHDLELVRRIVERQEVLQPLLDDDLLVVRRNDERDRRLDVFLADGSTPHPRQEGGREWITDVRPAERSQRAPEERLPDHSGNRRPRFSRPASER